VRGQAKRVPTPQADTDPLAARAYANDIVNFERITTDPDLMAGLPCIRRPPGTGRAGRRDGADGMSVEEIVTGLPDLVTDDVTEALRYAAEAVRQRGLPLRHTT